jgi:transporter family-2 protein
LPEFFRNKSGFSVFKPWFLVPGVLGFFIVTGIPLAISRLGAFKGFLGIIAAQLVGGLLWDFIVDGSSVSSTKITGAILAITGAALVFSKA